MFRDRRVVVRSFPDWFGSPNPENSVDGSGTWALQRGSGQARDTLILSYQRGEVQGGVVLDVLVADTGDAQLVKWLIEPGKGAITFERVSTDERALDDLPD